MSKTVTYKGPTPAGGIGTQLQVEDPDSGERALLVLDTPTLISDRLAELAQEVEHHRVEVQGSETDELTGQALKDRAAELDIDGRTSMTADELRTAIAEAEADNA